MKLTSRQRWIGYALAAAATVGAMAWVDRGPGEGSVVPAATAGRDRISDAASLAASTPAPKTAAGRSTEASALRSISASSREDEQPTTDPFGEPSWVKAALAAQVAAAAAAAPPPPRPAPPVAPPVPFTYLGRWVENGSSIAILDRQGEPKTATLHETLDGSYRVESIGETQLVLTYLPLRQRQVLSAGVESTAPGGQAASTFPASGATPFAGPSSSGDANSSD